MGLVPAGSAERFVEVDGGRFGCSSRRRRWLRSITAAADSRRRTDSAAISWYDVYAASGATGRWSGWTCPGSGGPRGSHRSAERRRWPTSSSASLAARDPPGGGDGGVDGRRCRPQCGAAPPVAGRGPGADRARVGSSRSSATGSSSCRPGSPPAARPASWSPLAPTGQHPGRGGAQGDGPRSDADCLPRWSPSSAGRPVGQVPASGTRATTRPRWVHGRCATTCCRWCIGSPHRRCSSTARTTRWSIPRLAPASQLMPDARLVLVPRVRPLGPARVPGPVPRRGPAVPQRPRDRGVITAISHTGTAMPTAPPTTVHLLTLGCARNEVDSEELAGRLAMDGFAWSPSRRTPTPCW